MNTTDLTNIGIPLDSPMAAAMNLLKHLFDEGYTTADVTKLLEAIVNAPEDYADAPNSSFLFG